MSSSFCPYPEPERLDLGHARISSRKALPAGSWTTLTFVYTAGHPVDDTGYIKIAFRYAGDFGDLQFDDPTAPNYCSVNTTGDCRIIPRWDSKGHTRPWGKAIYLMIRSGYLQKGETVTLVFGDTSGGSPGWRLPTFCQNAFEFKTLVDPIATYEFKELPVSPAIRIVPGKPAKMACIAPSQVLCREPFELKLKIDDMWGNPVGKTKTRKHAGFASPGIHTVTIRDKQTGLQALSNPVEVVERVSRQRAWADFHGQSEETIGSNSIDDYYRFARDMSCLQIAAHQGNDFQITDAFWEDVLAKADEFNEPGHFITFPGYEWSGNTPLGGDRNVYFAGPEGEIVHSCLDLLPGKYSQHPVAPTADDLFRALRRQKKAKPFVFAHVGGRYADLASHDDNIEVAVEVHSAWGTFEWLVDDALARRHRIGICANSDGHKGRPGASYPGASRFGSLGGLTCVMARELSREGVLKALKERRFYATTGHRPILDVEVINQDGKKATMGRKLASGNAPVTLRCRVTGTAPIESIQVKNGTRSVRTFRNGSDDAKSNRIKLLWRGAEVRGRARLVDWTGSLRIDGNRIVSFQPINFWNAENPIEQKSPTRLNWSSITTGGVAGIILELEESNRGVLQIETAQRKSVKVPLSKLHTAKRFWDCGGLRKRLEVYRLPATPQEHSMDIELNVRAPDPKGNPLYVRVTQEDGHMAWSSPIQIVHS